MLQKHVLDPAAFRLLGELMRDPGLKEKVFTLVGGTALALQIGHRMSTDLDLFTAKIIEPSKLARNLKQTFGDRCQIRNLSENGLRGSIDDCKIDMIHFPFPARFPSVEKDGIRLLSVDDLSTMKIHAVANRGLKRDFFDLAEILQTRPLNQVMENYIHRFKPSPVAYRHTLSSLTYFADAEADRQQLAVINGRKWVDVKTIVQNSVKTPSKVHTIPLPSLNLSKKETSISPTHSKKHPQISL